MELFLVGWSGTLWYVWTFFFECGVIFGGVEWNTWYVRIFFLGVKLFSVEGSAPNTLNINKISIVKIKKKASRLPC